MSTQVGGSIVGARRGVRWCRCPRASPSFPAALGVGQWSSSGGAGGQPLVGVGLTCQAGWRDLLAAVVVLCWGGWLIMPDGGHLGRGGPLRACAHRPVSAILGL